MSEQDEAIAVLNQLTGASTLSEDYVDLLKSLYISESDGYIIKLKINNEILDGQLTAEEVQPRLEQLLDNLAKTRIHDGYVNDYSEDLLLFLYNQDEEVTCDNCGSRILALDSFCSNCGEKYVPKISPFDLMTSISSQHITPGDVIRINKDNSIEITSIDEEHEKKEESVNYDGIEQSYENNIIINRLNITYFKTILLDLIYKYGNLRKLDNDLPISYNITNTSQVIKELINDNLMMIGSIDSYYNSIIDNADDLSLIPLDVWMQLKYIITNSGVDFLNSNNHVFYYDYYIKDSLVDDIIEFDDICRGSDQDVDESFIRYITIKRNQYLKNSCFDEYLATFTLESFYYEVNQRTDLQIISLLEKYIATLNINDEDTDEVLPAIDDQSMDFLKEVINSNKISFYKLGNYFDTAFDDIKIDKFIFSRSEALEYLFSFVDGEDISNVANQVKKLRLKKEE